MIMASVVLTGACLAFPFPQAWILCDAKLMFYCWWAGWVYCFCFICLLGGALTVSAVPGLTFCPKGSVMADLTNYFWWHRCEFEKGVLELNKCIFVQTCTANRRIRSCTECSDVSLLLEVSCIFEWEPPGLGKQRLMVVVVVLFQWQNVCLSAN